MEKLLTTAYKSNIIKFKLDDDILQRRFFLIFIESLEMIFSQFRETCELLLYYPKIGWEDIIKKKRPLGIFCMQILMSIAERLLLNYQEME